MILKSTNLGKKFLRDWIIKGFNYEFKSGSVYAVTGPNGSGKSTLLKLLAGYILPSKGNVEWISGEQILEPELQYKYMAVSAPYLQLIEELSLEEFIDFHLKFRKFKAGENFDSFMEKTGLIAQGNKQIKDFSSGMKQRVRLGLCFYFKNDFVFIDEGTTNLDKQGVLWFREEVLNLRDRLVILFSNQEEEYNLADHIIDLSK